MLFWTILWKTCPWQKTKCPNLIRYFHNSIKEALKGLETRGSASKFSSCLKRRRRRCESVSALLLPPTFPPDEASETSYLMLSNMLNCEYKSASYNYIIASCSPYLYEEVLGRDAELKRLTVNLVEEIPEFALLSHIAWKLPVKLPTKNSRKLPESCILGTMKHARKASPWEFPARL
uniref:Uncharacterized protein n=1 Tax=Trichogramma kaykai TaxID=54128 RepID=A0ABD2VX59_9HYME